MADIDNLYPGIEALLEHVDFLIASQDFPERLTGVRDLPKSMPEIAARFRCRVTAATLGHDGVLAWDGSIFHYSPGFRVETLDTTGAGDIFHAAFGYAVLERQPIEYALEFSCAAAALNCTALGARGGIRPVSEIVHLMRTGERYPPVFDAAALRRRSPQTTTRPEASPKKAE